VLVGVLSIAVGFLRVMQASGSPDIAMVLRSGADSEMVSGLSRDATRIIADAPGVARSPEGPLASAELFVILNLPKRSTGTDVNVPFRGVERAAFRVRDQVKIIDGRMFEWVRTRSSPESARRGSYRPRGRPHTADRPLPVARGGNLLRRRRQRRVGDLDRRHHPAVGLPPR